MKFESNSLSRRDFMAAAAGAGAAAISAHSYARILGANDRIGVGLIGVGDMGSDHAAALAELVGPSNLEPVAVADCWKTRADKGAAKLGAARSVQDYRKLLDLPEIDYVTIATPEHQHARMVLDALDAGKHIYCEKPLAHTIAEGFEVWDKSKSAGKSVQVGIQGMSDDSYASAGEAIRDGLLGKVVQAQIEYVRRYGEQGFCRVPDLDGAMPKPIDLNWEMWLGSAPKTSWNPHHYFEWRNYSSYSGGIATDLLTHRLARIMKACDLTHPRRVAGMGGIWQWPDGRDLPDNFEMICEYPRGMTVHVLGTMSNRHPIEHCIRGYRGTLFFTDDGWVAKDKDDKLLAEHKKTGAEDIVLHHANLHNHLRSGEPLNCPIEFAAMALIPLCMANESWRTGQMLAWDDEQKAVVSAADVPLDPFPDDAIAT
jgi:predicted dehydrogenase